MVGTTGTPVAIPVLITAITITATASVIMIHTGMATTRAGITITTVVIMAAAEAMADMVAMATLTEAVGAEAAERAAREPLITRAIATILPR